MGSLVGGVVIPLEDTGELTPTDDVNAATFKDLGSGVFGSTGSLGLNASCFVAELDPASALVLSVVDFGF